MSISSKWKKSPRKFKEPTSSFQNRRPNRKNRNNGRNFIYQRHNENFIKLRIKIEASIWYKSGPKGNLVNLTAFSFSKSETKFLNKNLQETNTRKVYKKNELDKLEAHLKDLTNKDTDHKKRVFKAKKTTDKNHHLMIPLLKL